MNRVYPEASRLVITADCGGSNGARVRLWKRELQRFANETGLADGVYEHGAAQYCVAIDGDKDAAPPHKTRRIVNFEDVEKIL